MPCNIHTHQLSLHASCTIRSTRRNLQVRAVTAIDRATERPLPPGDLGLPIIGQSLEFITAYQQFYLKRHAQHGKGPWKSSVLLNPLVVVSEEADVRSLLQAEHQLVESAWPRSMELLLGPSAILTAKKARHRQQRTLLSEAFTQKAVQGYLPTVTEVIRDGLLQAAEAGQPVPGWSFARGLAFDVACKVLLGRRMDSETALHLREQFEAFTAGLFSLPLRLPGTPFSKGMRARQNVRDILEDYIKSAQQNPGSRQGGQATALQLMVDAKDEDGAQLPLEDLKDQVLNVLFAGHETSGMMMSSLLQRMKRHPGVLERLTAEQREVRRQHGGQLTAEAVDKMSYGQAVINEELRLAPIVDGVWRRALTDLEIGGYRIPKGWTVQAMVGRTGKEVPEWETTAEQFDPSRFLEADGRTLRRKLPAGYMPWGEGPRRCLGQGLANQEFKVMLATLAYDVEWSLNVDEAWAPVTGLLRPVDGLVTTFSRRRHS